MIKLDLKFGREKIERIVGGDGWVLSNKGQELRKQINMLVRGKEFREDLCRIEIMSENADSILKKYGDKLANEIKVMRFKEENVYHLSPFYKIVCSWIYES